jgi:hypothetical protein
VVVAQLHDVAGYPQTGHEHLRALGDHQLDVGRHLLGQRGEQVDTERLVGEPLHRPDLLDHLVLAHGGGAEAAEAARLGDGGDQGVVRDAAHPGQHHRVLDLEGVGQAGAHRELLVWSRLR